MKRLKLKLGWEFFFKSKSILCNWTWSCLKVHTSDHEWPRVTTNDHEWPRVTTSDHEWPRVDHEWPRVTTSDHEWECIKKFCWRHDDVSITSFLSNNHYLTAKGPFLQTLAAEIDIYAMSEWGGGLGDRQGGGGGGGGRNLPPPAPFNLGSRHFSLTFRTLKATLPALPPPVHFPPSFLPGLQALSTSLPTPTSEGRKKKER